MIALTSEPDENGLVSLAAGVDVTHEMLAGARTTIAQVNPNAPCALGDTLVALDAFDVVVGADHQLVEAPAVRISRETEAICALIASRIPSGATLQVGIGSVGTALPAALRGRRGLGLHGGLLTDGLMDLVRLGAADGMAKEVDSGLAVAGGLLGTRSMYEMVDHNPAIALVRSSHLLSEEILSTFGAFVSVNSALEVDLTGQVNAETRDGVHVGAVGGQVDYVRAGARSRNGLSVIALPSVTRAGRSRITAVLPDGVVTTARSEVDIVVTEFGMAELQGRTLSERAQALVRIAHPEHRDELGLRVRELC